MPGNVIFNHIYIHHVSDCNKYFSDPELILSEKYAKYQKRVIYGAYKVVDNGEQELFYFYRKKTESPFSDIDEYFAWRGMKDEYKVVLDINGEPQVLGVEYMIPFSDIIDNGNKYPELIAELSDNNNKFYKIFEETREYYEALTKKYGSSERIDYDF